MELLDNIVGYSNRMLDPGRFSDYCPNGLQVQGRAEVRRLVTGVTASQRFLDAAIDAGADAVLVHHGYFWRGEEAPLIGMKRRRIATLLNNDVSLLAYHLPLDCHPEVGNNAQLGLRLGLEDAQSRDVDGVPGLFWHAELAVAEPVDSFVQRVTQAVERPVLAVGRSRGPVRSVGWCSGGAQRYVTLAASLGLDAFISGEISEQTTHEARENGLLYVAAGHHASERYGVQAFGTQLANAFDIEHLFIDVDNPA